MRLLFFLLLFLNVALFAYIYASEQRPDVAVQREQLQVAPDKMKLVGAPGRPMGAASAPSPLVCLEWGSFEPEEAQRAAAVLAKLELGDKVMARDSGEPQNGQKKVFVIRDPGDAVAARIVELKAEFPNAQLKAGACAGVGGAS